MRKRFRKKGVLKDDYVDLCGSDLFLSAAVFIDSGGVVGQGAVAQPGLQLAERIPAGIELSGVPRQFYCGRKYQRGPLSALQFNMFLPETLKCYAGGRAPIAGTNFWIVLSI